MNRTRKTDLIANRVRRRCISVVLAFCIS
jgi:hypothetical protein